MATSTNEYAFIVLTACVIFIKFTSVLVHGATDATLTANAKGEAVVDAAVAKITRACVFENDKRLLSRIAFVASGYGLRRDTFFKVNNQGDIVKYDGGIFEVDEDKFNETKDTNKHPNLTEIYQKIQASFGIDWTAAVWADLLKPMYSALAASLRLHLAGETIPWKVEDQAKFWATHYNTNPTKSAATFVIMVERIESGGCSSPRADIVFALDSSTSVSKANFLEVRKFVANVTSFFTIGKNDIHVAVIKYSTTALVEVDLTQFMDKDQLVGAINKINYIGGTTNSYSALMAMLDMFDLHGRPTDSGTPRIGVFLTDGQSNNYKMTEAAAKQVHQNNVQMFAVGVGAYLNNEELRDIASQPTCTHVFNLPTFDDVFGLVQAAKVMACKAPAFVAKETTIQSTLAQDQSQFLTLKVPPEGVTLKMQALSGTVEVFTSFTDQNPSSAVHDEKFTTESLQEAGGEKFIPATPPGGSKRRRRETKEVDLHLTVTGTSEGSNEFKLTAQDGDTRIYERSTASREKLRGIAILSSLSFALALQGMLF